MAWDHISFRGTSGMSGDKAIDEMALCLQRIAAHYQDTFSRLPSLAEILYALEMVIGSHPGRYVLSDRSLGDLNVPAMLAVRADSSATNAPEYEGAFVDFPPPGHFVIQSKGDAANAPKPLIDVRLDVRDRKLVCHYEMLEPQRFHEPVQSLIKVVLLDLFCDHFYDRLVDEIEFVTVHTGEKR